LTRKRCKYCNKPLRKDYKLLGCPDCIKRIMAELNR